MSQFKRALYPPGTTFEYFNIHHKGVIPYLNIQGPYYNINLNKNTYESIVRSGIKIYPVWDDPIVEERRKKAEERKKVQAEVERQMAEKEKEKEEEEARKREAEQALNQLKPSIIKPEEEVDEELPEPIKVIVGSDGSIRREDEPATEEVIEEVVDEEPVKIEVEDSIEVEEDVEVKPVKPATVPIRRVKSEEKVEETKPQYSKELLMEMTNEEIKDILRGRGHPEKRGDDLAPKYHDTKDDLIRKVLKLN